MSTNAPWLIIEMQISGVGKWYLLTRLGLLSWRHAVLLGVSFFNITAALADNVEMPAGWPWRGVNIAALSGNNEDLVRYQRTLNINMVRLHFLSHPFRGMGREAVIAASFQWLDQILDDCEKIGITAVVNLDFFPLGEESGIKSTPQFWSNQKYQDEILDVTRKFSAHFKRRGRELAAYDVMSEPLVYVDGQARSPAGWLKLQTQILQAIRQVDPYRWVVFAPGPGGVPEGYVNYSPPIAEKIVWGVHIYIPHAFTHQGIGIWPLGVTYPGKIHSDVWGKQLLKSALQPVLNFQKKHGGHVWVGEFSSVRWASGGEQYLHDVTDIFNEYKWGWTYFSGLDWHGWNPDYDSEFSTEQDSEKHRVGLKSKRWKTLKEIFRTNQP